MEHGSVVGSLARTTSHPLLLSPDGGHEVVFSEHPFGLRNIYLRGFQPDLTSFQVYRCADSFSQWIVNFFEESIEGDRHYEEMLIKYHTQGCRATANRSMPLKG
jgi:hypothetical protein